MKRFLTLCVTLLLFSLMIQPVAGQSSQPENDFKNQFMRHFDYASRVLSLAKAMPADSYSWQPSEEVYTVARVYAHIARYNYLYLESSLDIPAPEEIDVENMESLTSKEDVVAALDQSINHVKSAVKKMPDSRLSESTEMYGKTVNGQAVLMQLITHYSEHVGQANAYARMNEIVPPWNR